VSLHSFILAHDLQERQLFLPIDSMGEQQRCDMMDTSVPTNPTLHLPHVLRLLGPSSLTLYKHVLGRRRILVYTQPPIEPACILCQVAADICFEDQTVHDSPEGSTAPRPRLKRRQKEGIDVLGVVTLHDIGLLERESTTGCGWIACMWYFQWTFIRLVIVSPTLYRHNGCSIPRETTVLRPRY
jgi:hypothetical protein